MTAHPQHHHGTPNMKTLKILLLASALLLPISAQAWWNKDWKQRTQVILNTSAAGVPVQQPVNGSVVPVRLHSGNFDFLSAKPDGSDLRVVAGDDKTPLKYWVERFDSVNELGVLWVLVPSVLPGSDKNTLYVYAGNDKAPAEAPGGVFEAPVLAAFHFADKEGMGVDQTGTLKLASAVPIEANGLIGPSARLAGTAVTWPASDKVKAAGSGPYSVSLWVKPQVAAGTLFHQGQVQIGLANGALSAQVGAATVPGGTVAAGAWSQIVLTLGGGKATLYVNGAQAGQTELAAGGAAIEGDIQVGDGYQGLLDELEISADVRSADAIRLGYAAGSADAKLVATKTQTQEDASSEGGGGGYIGILVKSLTPDAWAVIAILFVMLLIAIGVMVMKALYVTRTEKANQRFLDQFRAAPDVLTVEATRGAGGFEDSSLYRLYRAGLVQLTKRDVGRDGNKLSGASLDAVKAAVDADSVREGYKLNAQMVLLTIAIAGGPFLGLLGTVIGVMITFASIAAAGDVNVNAIAPGIAAALLATVAGLGVAIPSLFGYNYLASKIKTISSDMQIFVDEFVTRVAELYGAR
jgi:biopolymer transport protein ExbB